MKKLLPVLLALSGLGIGSGAGMFFGFGSGDGTTAPEPEPQGTSEETVEAPVQGESAPATEPDIESSPNDHGAAPATEFEYVKLAQQFVVPVISETKVSSLVVISISLEITPGMNEVVYAHEPKLRDVFLQVMFAHAQSGGFSGAFTTGQAMLDFRQSLRQAAVGVLGDLVNAVLVTDMVRQDT